MPDTPESLAAHLKWLYGKRGVYGGDGRSRCHCDHAYREDRQGAGWVRTTTEPKCPFHGDAPTRYWDKHKQWPSGPLLIDGLEG